MQMRIYTLPIQLQFDSQPILFRILIVQSVVNGFCEFIARCTLVRLNHCTYHLFQIYSLKSSKIYRCWIVWGKNFGVMIIPSFLAITFISQSIYLHFISRFQIIVSSFLDSVRRFSINTGNSLGVWGIF